MIISTLDALSSEAVSVTVTDDMLAVALHDGRSIHVPLAWYPRLLYSTPEERADWLLIDNGRGIHWEVIDEDISVAGLLAGRPSGESARSFARWLAARKLVQA